VLQEPKEKEKNKNKEIVKKCN